MPLKSRFTHVEVEENPLGEWIVSHAKSFGNKVALVDCETKKSYTYAELVKTVDCVARGLHAAGLRKRDVVVVYLPNCPEYVFLLLAVAIRGGIVSGVHPAYTKEELVHQLEDSEGTFLVTHGSLLEVAKRAANQPSIRSQLKKIYVVDPPAGICSDGDVQDFAHLTNYRSSQTKLPPVCIDSKNDVFILPYSSGTTGRPKGVMVTHYNMVAQCCLVNSGDIFLWPKANEVYLAFLPLYHVFGLSVTIVCLRRGVTIVTVPKFVPEKFFQAVQDYKVKMLVVVPPVVVMLVKHPLVAKFDISTVNAVFCGAAPMGKDLSDELLKRHPSITYLVQGFGMTEVSGATHIMPPLPKHQMRHGSCGLLIPNVQCKVVDIGTGKELGPNEKGELCVYTVCCMKGYWKRPDSMANTIDSEGWLHTGSGFSGDICYYDEDEFFYVVDRLKDLIKVKGFQVAPAELEDLLLSHPKIQDSAVIAIPHPKTGELPRAYIVRKPGALLVEQEVHAFLKDRVAPYKQLKGGIAFVDELPKSPSGKLQRKLLKDRYFLDEKTSITPKL